MVGRAFVLALAVAWVGVVVHFSNIYSEGNKKRDDEKQAIKAKLSNEGAKLRDFAAFSKETVGTASGPGYEIWSRRELPVYEALYARWEADMAANGWNADDLQQWLILGNAPATPDELRRSIREKVAKGATQ